VSREQVQSVSKEFKNTRCHGEQVPVGEQVIQGIQVSIGEQGPAVNKEYKVSSRTRVPVGDKVFQRNTGVIGASPIGRNKGSQGVIGKARSSRWKQGIKGT